MATKVALKKEEKWVRRVPDLKPGRYADGMPLHELQYLQFKLILRPNHFTSRKSLFDFVKVLRRLRDDTPPFLAERAVSGVPRGISW